MQASLTTLLVGVVSGVASGMFGIGGGILMTPAIRLLLGYPELIAVGTPLAVIIPTTIIGAVQYVRRDSAAVREGVIIGLIASVGAVAGAYLARLAGGRFVLTATAVIILYVAIDMWVHAMRSAVPVPEMLLEPEVSGLAEPAGVTTPAALPKVSPLKLVGWSVATGLYAGFLGLGGGFIIVPVLVRAFGFSMKRAIGTSLVAISILSVPATLAHWALGHVDVPLALLLAIGAAPGAVLGARLTAAASERHVRIGFIVLLVVAGVWLGAAELVKL